MSAKQLLILGAAVLMSFLSRGALTGETQRPVVCRAELAIDPAQLESYKAVVKGEIDTSVRVEPGVLAIYCVAEKDNPRSVTPVEDAHLGYPASSSSRAFASWRSAVSKPSVNHL
jgi:hypothetical protein